MLRAPLARRSRPHRHAAAALVAAVDRIERVVEVADQVQQTQSRDPEGVRILGFFLTNRSTLSTFTSRLAVACHFWRSVMAIAGGVEVGVVGLELGGVPTASLRCAPPRSCRATRWLAGRLAPPYRSWSICSRARPAAAAPWRASRRRIRPQYPVGDQCNRAGARRDPHAKLVARATSSAAVAAAPAQTRSLHRPLAIAPHPPSHASIAGRQLSAAGEEAMRGVVFPGRTRTRIDAISPIRPPGRARSSSR